MAGPFVQKESVKRISSPEQFNDYLHVTAPALWAVLAAVILIVAGLFLWSNVAAVESYASGEAQVKDGVLTVRLDNEEYASIVEVGMNVRVGDLVTPVLSLGRDERGDLLVIARADLPDGTYPASVSYRSTRIIEMLFN